MEMANGKTMAFALLAENRYGYPENHTDKLATKSRTRTAQRWTDNERRMIVAKFRKKPVVIEAFRLNERGLIAEDWFWDAVTRNDIITHCFGKHEPDHAWCEIKTLEGTMIASAGDYIIQGVHGEIYPCKADIFQKTYTEDKPKTNADRIRTMSNEELVKMLTIGKGSFACFKCPESGYGECSMKCDERCLEWLQQPAEEDDQRRTERRC